MVSRCSFEEDDVKTRTTCLLLVAAALLFGVAATACSDSDNASSSNNASQQSVDQLSTRVQQNEMLTAWLALQPLPMHDLAETLDAGTIDPQYVPTLRTAIRVLALTNWTSDIKPDATQYHDDAVTLLQGIESGKAAADLTDAADAVHDDADAFKITLGNTVAKDLPQDAGGPVPTRSSEQPAGDATAEATAEPTAGATR
jgi:hypothetical protein